MTDLIDAVIKKYSAVRVLPIVSLQLDELGARLQDRATRDAAGVTATIRPGKSITIAASQAIRVPVTGAIGATPETYGAVTISRVSLAAGDTVTLPLVGAGIGDAGSDGAGSGTPAAQPQGDTVAHGGAGGGCSCALAASPGGSHGGALFLLAFGLGACALRRCVRG